MKKTIYLCLAVVLVSVFISCASMVSGASGMTQGDNSFIIVSSQSAGDNRVLIRYSGYRYLQLQEDKKASAELREPDYKNIPKNGYISIRLLAYTLEMASPENSTYILRDNSGKEVFRGKGHTSLSNIPDYNVSQYGTTWNGYDVIIIDSDVSFPLLLRVVTPDNNIFDFKIEENKSANQ